MKKNILTILITVKVHFEKRKLIQYSSEFCLLYNLHKFGFSNVTEALTKWFFFREKRSPQTIYIEACGGVLLSMHNAHIIYYIIRVFFIPRSCKNSFHISPKNGSPNLVVVVTATVLDGLHAVRFSGRALWYW